MDFRSMTVSRKAPAAGSRHLPAARALPLTSYGAEPGELVPNGNERVWRCVGSAIVDEAFAAPRVRTAPSYPAINIWTNENEIAGNGIDDDGNGYIDDVMGWDFVDQDNDPTDVNSHGTHVAGTIAAENDDMGITGVAYDAQIMPVKVLGDDGFGFGRGIADGIRYAADNGADIINLSLGSDIPSAAIEAAIQYATNQGAVVVMAAGNEGADRPGYPASFATTYGLSVGAVDRSSDIAPFSNRAGQNSRLHHVVAPGVAIESTIPGDRYDTFSGTSMATPHVAGVVALLLSANPDLTPNQVRQIIIESTTNLDPAL